MNTGISDPKRIEQVVLEILSEVLEQKEVPLEADILELGIDSIDIVRVAVRLEETFGRAPELDDFLDMASVADLVAYYRKR